MEEFREIHFKGYMLRIYRNGDIYDWHNKQAGYLIKNPYWKKRKQTINSVGYQVIHLHNKTYTCHRIIAMVYLDLDITDTSIDVDHLDRCRTNNNVNNLRIGSRSQNLWNNGGKGYSWNKRDKKWRARIHLKNKGIHLGNFNTEEEAREAYLKAKEIYHKID